MTLPKKSKRQLKQEEKNKKHLSKRRVKRKKHENEDVHSIVQKTTVGKYIYKLPMTNKQELLVEQTYADYIDSDVLGYRAKREAEEERKRLLKEKKLSNGKNGNGFLLAQSDLSRLLIQNFGNGGDYIERENGR